MNGVTIIVPNWNGRAVLEHLLGTLRAQTHPIAAILVIDNGSTDGSADAAGQAGARVIRLQTNLGFAAAVNRGIAAAVTDYLAIVNNDVELAPDWLQRLADALGDDTAWFAAGKILHSADRTRLDGTYDALSRGACAWRAGHGRPDGPEFSIRRRIFFAPGTAALFRAELFRRLGALDESFESYLEDVDLGLRCALAGLSGWYVPEALAWHRGSATLGRWHPRTVRLISRNQVLLVAKHYPAGLVLRCAWPILVGQILWGLVALRHGAGWAWLRGKLAALARLPRRHAANPADLRRILEASEQDIFRAQLKTGFDSYWRWYFRLTRPAGKPTHG
jgi:GT2 family glycosyltransferase